MNSDIEEVLNRKMNSGASFLLGLVLLLLYMFSIGFCGNKLWEWYLTEPYGLMAPGVFGFYGIFIIVQILTMKRLTLDILEEPRHMPKMASAYAILISWMALFVGWILHL